jgi:hypothetical protein
LLARIADDQLSSLCSCEALQKTRIPDMSADSSNRSRSTARNLVPRCPEGPETSNRWPTAALVGYPVAEKRPLCLEGGPKSADKRYAFSVTVLKGIVRFHYIGLCVG